MFQTRPFRSPSLCSALHLHHWKQVKNLIRYFFSDYFSTFFLKIWFSKESKTLILRPEYLTTDGVYRQSGNLSVVQRLRLQIEQGNLAVLDTVDDVHVLTGALKLFFRELQEPLIPWEVGCFAILNLSFFGLIFVCNRNSTLSLQAVEKLLSAVNLPSKKAKLKQLKEIIARSFDMNKQSCILWALKLLFGCEIILDSMSVKPIFVTLP